MKKLAILGHHISYTLSPRIHEAALRSWSVEGKYDVVDVSPDQLEESLERLWKEGYHGLNVTKPHKSAVAKLCGSSLESVNALVRGKKGWVGYSTDGEGLARALRHMGCEVDLLNRVVILGGGGVLKALLSDTFPSCRDVIILERRQPEIWSREYLEGCLKGRGRDTLLVQATSAPQQGDRLEWFAPALDSYNGFFVDLVYGTPSALYHAAKERGLSSQEGLPMLLEQARLCQELWFGKSLSYEDLWKVVTNGADERN